MQTDEDTEALEALTGFLYVVPVGLLQFKKNGAVQLVNPLASQLLMPLVPNCDFSDAYSLLSPLVPELARLVREYTKLGGVIIDHLRCEIAVGSKSLVLSVTVHRIHDDSNLVILEDVTLLVEKERQIYADRQRFRAIFDNVKDYAIFTINADGLIDAWNQSLERFGGWQAADVLHKPFSMFFTEEDNDPDFLEHLLIEARTAGSVETEGWCRCRNGERIWANTVLTVLPDISGEVRGFVVVSRDMTERKRMEDELRRLATTDPLTGAFNRRSGQAIIDDAFRLSRSDGLLPGVLMLDIDHFKVINDTYGHDAGDAALRDLVGICRDILGSSGSVARWGGEEFLLILPSTRTADAQDIAEKLRAAVEAAVISTTAGPVSMTVSIGVTVGGKTPETIIQCADAALYAAKNGGRNCVMLSVSSTKTKI